MDMQEDGVLIGYYEGSDGPTIILISKAEQSMRLLRDIVSRLSTNDQLEMDLGNEPSIQLFDLSSFVLVSDDRKHKTFEQSVYVGRVKGGEKPQARWVKSRARWKDTLELINGLIASGGGRHQYLEEPFSEDAVIELSYKEEGVARWET
ncbi:MAG: hypothetical protein JSV52_12785 [Candidatus Zixiibacteriota bacterium]|nr:MAG: hypothetical protein JSV52_12785 [candidate division Zixibacteria bacterium]